MGQCQPSRKREEDRGRTGPLRKQQGKGQHRDPPGLDRRLQPVPANRYADRTVSGSTALGGGVLQRATSQQLSSTLRERHRPVSLIVSIFPALIPISRLFFRTKYIHFGSPKIYDANFMVLLLRLFHVLHSGVACNQTDYLVFGVRIKSMRIFSPQLLNGFWVRIESIGMFSPQFTRVQIIWFLG